MSSTEAGSPSPPATVLCVISVPNFRRKPPLVALGRSLLEAITSISCTARCEALRSSTEFADALTLSDLQLMRVSCIITRQFTAFDAEDLAVGRVAEAHGHQLRR